MAASVARRAVCLANVLQSFNKSTCLTPVADRLQKKYSFCQTRALHEFTGSRKKVAYLKELYRRRRAVGPEPERHPSVYGCWSHDAELYTFGQRFGEEFREDLLRTAFRQRSYKESEQEKQKSLGLDTSVDFDDNTQLADKGRRESSRFIKAYLRYSYPELFEEGICAVHDYLMSDETLVNVANQLGLRELIQSASYPPEEQDYTETLMAVIGALFESQEEKRGQMFVLDFIVAELVGKDINDVWHMVNPMSLLAACLKVKGQMEPEARLLWKSATNTITPLYHVGIYCNQELIGRAPGESVEIAEEMAARDALKKLTKTADSRPPLVMGEPARHLELDLNKTNRLGSEIISEVS